MTSTTGHAGDMSDLTRRQRDIVVYVADCYYDEHYSPSLRDIAKQVGLASAGGVAYQVDVLISKGWLRHEGNRLVPVGFTPPDSPAEDPRADPQTGILVPVVASIAAGFPISTDNLSEEELVLPPDAVGKGDMIALRVQGDSMIDANISHGDYIVIRRQEVAVNGDLVAARIQDEATVKRYEFRDGHVRLVPRNDAYPTLDGDEAEIVGKVVCIVHRV